MANAPVIGLLSIRSLPMQPSGEKTSDEIESGDRRSGDGLLDDRWRGRWCAIIAALLWSTSGLFVKSPLFESWPAEHRGLLLAFWRAVFAGLAVLPLVRRVQWNRWLIPMGGAFAAMTCTYLMSLVEGAAALAIWLQQLAPLWVVLVTTFVLRERLQRADRAMVICCIAGVLVIVLGAVGDGSHRVAILGLLSSLSYAAVILTMRKLRGLDAGWLVIVSQASSALVLLPYVIRHQPSVSAGQWLGLIALGAFQIGLPYFFFAQALRRIPPHEASLLALLEPLLVPVWVWWCWSHRPDYQGLPWTVWAGGGAILLGLITRYLAAPLLRRSR
jgi:drug/metabolite transporter, DME family